jgi:uncharacterized protein with FMN-binding domain
MASRPRDPYPFPVRATLAVAGTMAGLVLLTSFRTPDVGPEDTAGPISPFAVGEAGASGPTAPPSPLPASASGDATGPAEQTPFGDVQVEVKVNGGRITDVVAVQLPTEGRRSLQIGAYAEPILHSEALKAQSAAIDLISGATWTSGGYQASLQAALAKIAGG